MRIYSSRGFFGLSGDCSIELLGNFTDYDRVTTLLEDRPTFEPEQVSPEAEQLIEAVDVPTPRRLSGMLSR